MKKVFQSIIIILIALPMFGQSVTFTTLNCEFLIKDKIHVKLGERINMSSSDKNKWATIRESKFREAVEQTAETLVRMNSDVYALTEIGNVHDVQQLLEAMNRRNPQYKYYSEGETQDTYTRQNVAMISKYRTSPIQKQIRERELYFPEDDDKFQDSESAVVSKAGIFRVEVGAKIITVIIAHLKSEIGGGEADAKRIAQATILRRKVIELETQPVIICGDFNDIKGSPTLLQIRGFNDINKNLYQTTDTKYFKEWSDNSTYKYKGIPMQIDHVLVNQSLMEMLKSRSPIVSWTSFVPVKVSDHRAMTIQINFK